jgi:release factor glutamine methyltransferase
MSERSDTADSTEAIDEAHRAGRRVFMGVTLEVGPGALVPRAETELLGRTAARILAGTEPRAGGSGLTVIDMCCGSGNLACALAAGDARLRVFAADLTDGCVALTRRNVAALGLTARVTVRQGDLFGALAGDALTGVDMIVANPPYISSARLAKDRAVLLEREPIEAFDGGPYGISVHQRLVREAIDLLRPGGWLLFEIGLGQERQVKLLFDRARAYADLEFIADADGQPRVAVARRPGVQTSDQPNDSKGASP